MTTRYQNKSRRDRILQGIIEDIHSGITGKGWGGHFVILQLDEKPERLDAIRRTDSYFFGDIKNNGERIKKSRLGIVNIGV